MSGDVDLVLTKMVGTLAVLLIAAAFIGGSDLFAKYLNTEKRLKYYIISGVLGGAFGIYGNISGFALQGAVVSVRDIGPMLAGFSGGPVGGLIAGLISGIHRLTMGGITAQPCVVATCCIGFTVGMISWKRHGLLAKPLFAFVISALMEMFHLSLVLLMGRPFETALSIVKQIAFPFILVNALGFMLLVMIIGFIEKQRELTVEKSRLESELEVANVIQHSLLPLLNEDYPGCKGLDVSAYMEAAKEVGGDFYDVFYVDQSHLAFLIGDASGKGVPAALFMASSKVTLQNCIRDISKLSEAVTIANNSLCARNEAEMFITLWVGVLDITDGTLHYVCAGHNPPILVNDGKAEYLRTKSGFVVGGLEDMEYEEHTVKIGSGDTLFMYTDGVTEAEDENHELFGEDRLLECFENAGSSGPAEIIEGVNESIEGFINGTSQFDDMTMLCFKWQKES